MPSFSVQDDAESEIKISADSNEESKRLAISPISTEKSGSYISELSGSVIEVEFEPL